jgi:hypothetical protein
MSRSKAKQEAEQHAYMPAAAFEKWLSREFSGIKVSRGWSVVGVAVLPLAGSYGRDEAARVARILGAVRVACKLRGLRVREFGGGAVLVEGFAVPARKGTR